MEGTAMWYQGVKSHWHQQVAQNHRYLYSKRAGVCPSQEYLEKRTSQFQDGFWYIMLNLYLLKEWMKRTQRVGSRELGSCFRCTRTKWRWQTASSACPATLESLSSDKSVTIGLIHECFIETTVQIILMYLDGIFFRNVKVSDEFLLVCLFSSLSALVMGILQAMSQRALRLPNPMSPLHSCLPGSHLQALTLNWSLPWQSNYYCWEANYPKSSSIKQSVYCAPRLCRSGSTQWRQEAKGGVLTHRQW